MAQWRTVGGEKSDPLVCTNCSEGTSGHWRGWRPSCHPVAGTGGCTVSCCRHRQGAVGRRRGGKGRLDERRRAAFEQRLVVDRTGSWAA
jgi:hypothetical protein